MTNLAKPAKMSNTAFVWPRCRFSRPFPLIFLFSSIFLDSPRFSILLDFPRFSSILLDSPRFSSILLYCFRLLFVGKSNTHFATCAIFSPFSFFGGLSPHNWTFCTLLSHFPPKIAKLPFFWQKVPLCIILALCLKNLQHWSFLHKWTFLSVFPSQSSKTAGFCARTAFLDNTG